MPCHFEGGLHQYALAILGALKLEDCELSLLITNDASIRPMNLHWRGHDKATDVLSFPQEEVAKIPGQPVLLGDVVISLETAARQANDLGHSLEEECAVLLVHGVLHLLGHDHLNAEQAQIMRAEEARILNILGHDNSLGLITRTQLR